MRTLPIALIGLAAIAGGAPLAAAAQVPAQPPASPAAPPAPAAPKAPPPPAMAPPAPPADDSIYRLGREAVAGGEFGRAADLFQALVRADAASRYAPDALYWEAYSLSRLGGTASLEQALAALERQASLFPSLAARGDAPALRARIEGMLAARGDVRAAEAVVEGARYGVAPSPRVSARAVEAATAAAMAAAASSAARRGSTRAAEMTAASLWTPGSVPPGCPAERDDERVMALNALVQMDADRATPILERVMARRDECSATLRRRALLIVGQKDGPQREAMLMKAVREDPDPDVRSRAVLMLSQTNEPRVVDLLAELLKDSTDARVQQSALMALGTQDSPRATALIRDLAGNASAPRRIRERAIMMLGQRESAESSEFMRQLYGSLSDNQLKERVLMTVAQSRTEGSERWLMQVVRDQSQPVELRGRALFWLGQGDRLPTSELASLYGELQDRTIKEQVILALSQRPEDGAAVDELIRIARTEQDRTLRQRAIFWLGQSGDPRVADFLIELIDR